MGYFNPQESARARNRLTLQKLLADANVRLHNGPVRQFTGTPAGRRSALPEVKDLGRYVEIKTSGLHVTLLGELWALIYRFVPGTRDEARIALFRGEAIVLYWSPDLEALYDAIGEYADVGQPYGLAA